jgi:hypothetical protein
MKHRSAECLLSTFCEVRLPDRALRKKRYNRSRHFAVHIHLLTAYVVFSPKSRNIPEHNVTLRLGCPYSSQPLLFSARATQQYVQRKISWYCKGVSLKTKSENVSTYNENTDQDYNNVKIHFNYTGYELKNIANWGIISIQFQTFYSVFPHLRDKSVGTNLWLWNLPFMQLDCETWSRTLKEEIKRHFQTDTSVLNVYYHARTEESELKF